MSPFGSAAASLFRFPGLSLDPDPSRSSRYHAEERFVPVMTAFAAAGALMTAENPVIPAMAGGPDHQGEIFLLSDLRDLRHVV